MATQYLPLIHEKDFEAFRRLLGPNLPDTYDGWRQLSDDRALKVVKFTGGNHHAVLIEADPDEFATWPPAEGKRHTLHDLDRYIDAKASRRERD